MALNTKHLQKFEYFFLLFVWCNPQTKHFQAETLILFSISDLLTFLQTPQGNFSFPVVQPSFTLPIPFTRKSSKNVSQPGPGLISPILYAAPSHYYCWPPTTSLYLLLPTPAVCYSYPPRRDSVEVCHTGFFLCLKLPSSFWSESEKKYISTNMFLCLSMWECVHIKKHAHIHVYPSTFDLTYVQPCLLW